MANGLDQVEKLARAMTTGDPDRLCPVGYDEVVGKPGTAEGSPKIARRTAMLPAWKFHEAEARAALSRDQL